MKKITVIIPFYNSTGTLRNCILSVIGTQYSALEIIIVDDVSTDGSLRIAESLAAEYAGTVKVVRHEKNAGPAKARNTGARHATGEYLFFLDSDTEMLPDALGRFAERIEEADAVTGIYYYEPINPGLAQNYKALLNFYFFSKKGVIPYEVFDSARAGIRSSVFRDLGGFKEDLGWGMDYENEEFGYRLCKRYKNLLDPSVMVRHVFPGLGKMARVYFLRVSLWMEIYLRRKQFESGGVTSVETGVSTGALLCSIATLPLVAVHRYLCLVPLTFFALYLYGYYGFFVFVLKKKRGFIIPALVLQVYCSVVIALAALNGLVRVVTGRSETGSGLEQSL